MGELPRRGDDGAQFAWGKNSILNLTDLVMMIPVTSAISPASLHER
jgi:hypothetical protein